MLGAGGVAARWRTEVLDTKAGSHLQSSGLSAVLPFSPALRVPTPRRAFGAGGQGDAFAMNPRKGILHPDQPVQTSGLGRTCRLWRGQPSGSCVQGVLRSRFSARVCREGGVHALTPVCVYASAGSLVEKRRVVSAWKLFRRSIGGLPGAARSPENSAHRRTGPAGPPHKFTASSLPSATSASTWTS